MKLAVLNDVVFGYASAADWPSGGAERYQWLLARALAAEGWTVTVGVRGWMKPKEHRVIDGVQFVGIESGNILKAWYRFLASERPDWWHWQCADRLWGLGVGIAKAAGVKTVFGAQVDRDVEPRLLDPSPPMVASLRLGAGSDRQDLGTTPRSTGFTPASPAPEGIDIARNR